jgi:hypothetical protein
MAMRKVVFALGLAAPCEAGKKQAPDDPELSSLMGQRTATSVDTGTDSNSASGLRSMLGENSGREDCGCLNWAATYYTQKAYCGRANELYFLAKHGFNNGYAATEPITGLPHKVCWDFFANFNSTACVNVDLMPFPADNQTGSQWCYVNPDCQQLNGGKFATNRAGFAQAAWMNLQANSYVPWKYCIPGGDDMLKFKSVEEIDELAREKDLSVSRMLRLAFPAVEVRWAEAQYFYERLDEAYNASSGTATLTDMLATLEVPSGWDTAAEAKEVILRGLVNSQQPTVLDSPGHSDEFHVVSGRAVYSVTRIANGNMAYLSGHFYKEFVLTCMMGCAARREPAREAVDLDTL